MDKLVERIRNWMESHRAEYLSDLSVLVAVDSTKALPEDGAPFGKGNARVLSKALGMAEKYGFENHNFENYVGTVLLSEKPVKLDILAHLDVVGAGEGWNTDPFELTSCGDFVFGRGVCDDKGPALSAIYALRCVKDLGIELKHGCRLILGCDEEIGSSDLEYYFASQTSAPFTFSPDAAFPVCNAEKGRYRPEFVLELSPEDNAERRVIYFHSGIASNIVPEKAEAELCGVKKSEIQKLASKLSESSGVRFDITENGKVTAITALGTSAHASTPYLGSNALTAMLALISELELCITPSSKALTALSRLMPHGETNASTLGMRMGDDKSGDLTLAFSMLELKDGRLCGRCDLRLPFCATEENTREVFESALKKVGFSVVGNVTKPHYVPSDSDFVTKLNDSFEKVTGEKGGTYSMGGGTYVHDIEGGVAFGAGFGGYECNEHGANEKMKTDDLLKAAAVFAAAICSICKD